MPKTPEQNEQIRAQRHAQILRAAIDLFSRQGYADTSVSAIARAAGVSHGTVFLYFPTKDDLFEQAFTTPLEEALAHYDRILAAPGSPLARIRLMVQEQVAMFARERSYLRLVQYVLAHPDRFRTQLNKLFGYTSRYSEAVAELVRAGQAAGELGPGDPIGIADSYHCFLNGVGLVATAPPDHPIWPQLVKNGIRLFGPRIPDWEE